MPVPCEAMSGDEAPGDSDHPDKSDNASDGHSDDSSDNHDAPDQAASSSGLQSGCDHDQAMVD